MNLFTNINCQHSWIGLLLILLPKVSTPLLWDYSAGSGILIYIELQSMLVLLHNKLHKFATGVPEYELNTSEENNNI